MGCLFLALHASGFCALSAPAPVILDTDLGDDIDDTWALAMLLGSPEVDLKLIVTASDDTAKKARLVARILEGLGRTDIPIGIGVKTSDQPIHQEQWLGDYGLDGYSGKVIEDGVGALVGAVTKAPAPVTLLVIGPQTNIKAALERDPAIARNARVVAMAGSIEVGYDGASTPQPEYNVSKDVVAARAVFAAPWDITIAPLDICGSLRLTGGRYARVAQSKNPRALVTIENYDQWANRAHHPADSSSVLFDTAAAYLAFSEDLCDIETRRLSIDDHGGTVPDDNGRPVRCALRWKDRDAFEELLVNALTTDPSPASAPKRSETDAQDR